MLTSLDLGKTQNQHLLNTPFSLPPPEGSPFLWRPISQLKFKTQKHKITKMQNVVCNAQIISVI